MASYEERGNKVRAIVWSAELGKKISKTFKTEADAKQWAYRQEIKKSVGDEIKRPEKETLAAVIDAYIAADGDWSQTKTDGLMALHRDLGTVRLKDLTKPVIIDYIKGRKAEFDLSLVNGNMRLANLAAALYYAADQMHLNARIDQLHDARRALAKADIIGSSEERDRRPTDDETRELIRANRDHSDRPVDFGATIEFLNLMPFRVGELYGIKWLDLDETRRTVLLRSRKHPRRVMKKRNHQLIPLLTIEGIDTFDLLWKRKARLGNQDGPFPYRVKHMSDAMIEAREMAGVDDLHVHDYRAHSITKMLERGNEPMDVMHFSGHRDPRIFFQRYVRHDVDKLRDRMK